MQMCCYHIVFLLLNAFLLLITPAQCGEKQASGVLIDLWRPTNSGKREILPVPLML